MSGHAAERGIEIAEIEVGAVIDGTVERITPYGAFLQLEDGKVGLVHISEIDRNYVKDVHEHLREGDVVQAKVWPSRRTARSTCRSRRCRTRRRASSAAAARDPEFEQKLKQFMKQSEERQVDYKRSVEHKRK